MRGAATWLVLLGAMAWLATLSCPPAHAAPFLPGQQLDQPLVADVAAVALAFMAPRILEPISVSQLSLWGLRGLTTLDPRLTPEARDGALALRIAEPGGERLLEAMPAPPDQDPAAWGRADSELIRAGWNASSAVRHAGTQGVIHTFFDELFNHLDPYSRYEPPEQAQSDQDRRDGRAGIGATLTVRGHALLIGTVAPDGPAALAGVHSGERLVAVDGDPVQVDAETSADDIAASLTGPDNSSIVLRVRDARGHERDVTVTRAVEVPRTVHATRQGDLLVLRVDTFARDTGARLGHAITAALAAPGRHRPRGVVVDLRGNRGGLLNEAVAAADTLLPGGTVAVTAGRDARAAHVFEAGGHDDADGLPVVVLVDGRSASAAEILAAALADQHRAVVVGSATLGKGLVQTIAPLPDGGALFVTWSRVLAPLGWPLQGLGVLPQVCTSLGQTEMTRQLDGLLHGEQPMERALTRSRDARAPLPPAEALEIRAACPAAVGGDGDMAAARFLVDHPQAYAAALLGPAAR